ncbi:MAG: tripartite tricarboxylate transporter substrate-binding protein [Candidatus Moduliflexus flocculans]|nr:tripartite tricarboxylate transporter substrate-binding protein [Candidatus Moduliflexus flocculans]
MKRTIWNRLSGYPGRCGDCLPTRGGRLPRQTDPAHHAVRGGRLDRLSWPGPWRSSARSTLPQPLVVVNKRGGRRDPRPLRVDVVRARPDGYTVLFGWGSGEDLVVPHRKEACPTTSSAISRSASRLSIHLRAIMAVPGSCAHKTLAEFVSWAKTKEYVTASVSTRGASVDITLQMLAKAAGLQA